jgi:small subunit ribosomal protein S1
MIEIDAVLPSVPPAQPVAVIEPLPAPAPVSAPAPSVEPIVAEPPVAAESPVAESPVVAEVPVADVPVAEPPVAAIPPHDEAKPAKRQPTEAELEARRKRAQQSWDNVVAAKEGNTTVPGFVVAAVKGGLLVDVSGIRGFLPASQVRVEKGTAIESIVKSRVPLKVIDVDASRRRIVVSHRRALEDERRAKRSELLALLAVGQTHEATVVRLADFGAFADIGGIDGLIPMSELAFERVEKVTDVLAVGDKLTVTILRIEEGGKKIALSRKNALPDPWRDHADLLRVGNVVDGKVVGKEPRLQVEIAPGVVGSVRESDADPADYEIGEAIEVAVRNLDRRTRRITLTTMHGAAAMPAPTSSGFAPLGIELKRR